jgi:hypothetical protein
MIVTRSHFLSVLHRLTGRQDKLCKIEPTPEEATAIAHYALRILPLAVQAEAWFWETGGKVESPKAAALILALHQAEPEAFAFPDCLCGKQLQQGDCTFRPGEPCGRVRWLDALRERAAMPAAIATREIPVPQRGVR